MAKLNKHLAIMALLAGTALATSPVYAQDQSGAAMDQSQGMDQGTDGGGSSEELLKNQNQATSGEDATMPDPERQDQAVTPEAQDPAMENQDQATDDELLRQKNQSEDQAQSPRHENQSEDQASDQEQLKQKNRTEDQAQSPSNDEQDQSTADRDRREDRNQDTATDTRRTKTDESNDRAASDRPSNETTGSIDISIEQKTVIKNTIVETKVKPADVDIKVRVGVSVPNTVVLHPLPPRVIELVPAYRDYVYFLLADGTIVIVDPDSHEVVYVITA